MKFNCPKLLGIASSIVTIIIGIPTIIIYIFTQKNVFNIIWSVLKFFWNLNIPDFLIILFFIILLIFSFSLKKKFDLFSPDKIKQIISENDFVKKINVDLRDRANEIIRLYDKTESELKKIEKKTMLFLVEKEKLEDYLGNDEIISILSYLANDINGSVELETLYNNSYREKFRNKARSDYRTVLVFLTREKLVQYVPNSKQVKCAMITDEGIEYLASKKIGQN